MSYFKGTKTGQEMAKARYADGGVAGALSNDADNKMDDVRGAMRAGADKISNPDDAPGSGSAYYSRTMLKGDKGEFPKRKDK